MLQIIRKDYTEQCNLLAAHNPIIFDFELTDDGITIVPDSLPVEIYDDDGTLLGTFNAVKNTEVGSVYTYLLYADEIFRAFMPDFDDLPHEIDRNLEYVESATKVFVITASYGENTIIEQVVCMHAARQYGVQPALLNIYNNDDEVYFASPGYPVAIYFYNNDTNNIIGAKVEAPAYMLNYLGRPFRNGDGTYFKAYT